MPDELIGFDEALKLLQISETELQGMVARGELRAYRAGGAMKFKRADVDGLRRQRETEPTIIIPASAGSTAEPTAPTEQAAPVGAGAGEIRLEMPGDEIDESAQTVGPAPAAPERGTEDLVFDDSELEVLPLEDEMAGTATVAAEEATVVSGGPEEAEITVATEGEVGFEETVPVREGSGARRAESVSGRTMISRRTSAAFAVKRGNPVMAVALILAAAVAIFTLSVFGVILITDYRTKPEEPAEKYVPGYLQNMAEDMKTWGDPKQP